MPIPSDKYFTSITAPYTIKQKYSRFTKEKHKAQNNEVNSPKVKNECEAWLGFESVTVLAISVKLSLHPVTLASHRPAFSLYALYLFLPLCRTNSPSGPLPSNSPFGI